MVFNLVRLFSAKPGAFFQFHAIAGVPANSIGPSVFVAFGQDFRQFQPKSSQEPVEAVWKTLGLPWGNERSQRPGGILVMHAISQQEITDLRRLPEVGLEPTQGFTLIGF